MIVGLFAKITTGIYMWSGTVCRASSGFLLMSTFCNNRNTTFNHKVCVTYDLQNIILKSSFFLRL